MAFPRLAAFKPNYKGEAQFVRFVNNEDGGVKTHMKCDESGAVSPFTKFAMEPSSFVDQTKGLVNIKCCYNHKYWSRSSENEEWIVAGVANEPNEDLSSWSCTLFEPIFVSVTEKTFRLRHAQLGSFLVIVLDQQHHHHLCLKAAPAAEKQQQLVDVFTFVDLGSVVVLPQYLRFKGSNGHYLGALNEIPYLRFGHVDKGTPAIRHQIYSHEQGQVHIKSNYKGYVWRYDTNWILADSSDYSGNQLVLQFWPVKVSHNSVALRSAANNNYCKSLTIDGKSDCLNAALPTITSEAIMELEELVLLREVNCVVYDLDNARIYDRHVIAVGSQTVSNPGDVPASMTVHITKTNSVYRSWSNSLSFTLGVEFSFKVGIPEIAEAGISVSAEFSDTYQWGKEEQESVEIGGSFTYTVPAKSKVTITAVATGAKCDVPFSYSQTDTTYDGPQAPVRRQDGIFTGVNYFNVEFTPTHIGQEP